MFKIELKGPRQSKNPSKFLKKEEIISSRLYLSEDENAVGHELYTNELHLSISFTKKLFISLDFKDQYDINERDYINGQLIKRIENLKYSNSKLELTLKNPNYSENMKDYNDNYKSLLYSINSETYYNPEEGLVNMKYNFIPNTRSEPDYLRFELRLSEPACAKIDKWLIKYGEICN